jgi:hypothetical protein
MVNNEELSDAIQKEIIDFMLENFNISVIPDDIERAMYEKILSIVGTQVQENVSVGCFRKCFGKCFKCCSKDNED